MGDNKSIELKKKSPKKMIGVCVDIVMYILMILQMIYVFTGNTIHEILGITFFVCLVIHMIIKKYWFKTFLKRKVPLFSARRFADLMIVLLFLCLILLMLSSMGVSRLIFPDIRFMGNPFFHRLLATLALIFAVIHGLMHAYFAAKKKKRVVIWIVILSLASLAFGFYGVDWLNRHFKIVSIHYEEKVYGEKITWNGKKPLIVYFTRLGNTDFDADIDAVSGASLLFSDDELMGNTELMADMTADILSCDTARIQLTDYHYPSSYAETCSVAQKELKSHLHNPIEPIDITDYDSIILIYPIWWGTIPMPVETFLSENDFSGKTIYLLATQGSSGFASSTRDIRKVVPAANVIEGLSLYCDDIPDAREVIFEWLGKIE